MRNRALFVFVTVLVLVVGSPAIAQNNNGLEQNLQFVEWMGMVLPPHSSLIDYPGYPEGVEFDPANLGLIEVVARKSWSILTQDRKTGRVIGDIIHAGEKYWTHPDDSQETPVYESGCLNRAFAFAGELTRDQILTSVADLADLMTREHFNTDQNIERLADLAEELRDRIPVDRCHMFGECEEEGGIFTTWYLWGLALGLVFTLAAVLVRGFVNRRRRGIDPREGEVIDAEPVSDPYREDGR